MNKIKTEAVEGYDNIILYMRSMIIMLENLRDRNDHSMNLNILYEINEKTKDLISKLEKYDYSSMESGNLN